MKNVYLFLVVIFAAYTGFAQSYCSPSFSGASTACSAGINFTKFAVTGVSGTSINDLGVCNGTTNYTNNAATMSVSLSRGGTYPITLMSSASFAMDVQVWIDFDDNLSFESSETVAGMTNYVSPATINLSIPGGGALGSHRMRIICNYTACCGGMFYPSISACGTGITYGEARDYTAVIGVSNAAPVFTNGSSQTLQVCLSSGPVSLNTILEASDADAGQTITWAGATAPAHGTLSASYSTTSTGGALTPVGLSYTPTAGYSGYDVFAVSVSDGIASSTTTVGVNINVISPVTGTSTFPVGYNTTLFNATTGGTWSSGNTSVATAGSTGLITGVSTGTATISYAKATVCGVLYSTLNVSVVPYASSPIITAFAGINAYGYSGNGGPATAAMLNTVEGLAIDAAGNIYIADYANHVIRKVNTSGGISTIAGTNVAGYSGDGGQASAAKLYYPTRLCFDATGNLFFTDQRCVIRKVSTSGIITTVAGNGTMASSGDGGPASSASFYDPYGICIDAGGNIYVGEYQGYRVRKISSGGVVSTFAGNGTTAFTGDGGPASAAAVGRPMGLCFDAAGNMLIADSYNNVIRKVNTSGTITTIAGTGGYGYSGDGGPATAATFNLPWDITVDAAGNIIIGDLYNQMVRKINTAGIVSTLAGTGVSGITGDGGPATAAKLNYPYAVVTDGAGNIYIGGNTTVRKIGSTSATAAPNRVPTFVNGASQSASGCSGVALNLSYLLPVNDSDVGQTETWTVKTGPVNGTLSGFSTTATATGGSIAPTGTTYTPAGGFSGLDSFTIRVSDGTDTALTKITVSVNPLTAITGATAICQGNSMTVSNATPGGAWSSSNTSVATVGTTGIVTGAGPGTASISYTLPTGCVATAMVTIYATPGTITGALFICQGATSGLSSDLSGGFWSSSNTSVATINSTSGVASGIGAGTAGITYTMGTGCQTFSVMTVIASPAAITGTTTVCAGANTTLSSSSAGGFWSSSNTAIGTVGSSSGTVTGISGGSVLISYTNPEGCSVWVTVSVNPAADAGTISGATSVCTGGSTTLSNTVSGGTWSSSNTAIATINSFAGVSGVAAGTVIISYSKSNGCGTTVATKVMTVNVTPVAGTITGTATTCTGSTTTLANATGTAGGVWTSSATSIATVGSTTGIVNGIASGTAVISYSITNTCGAATATRIVTVNSLSAGTITGEDTTYVTATTTLSGTVAGGTWSSSNTSVASVGSSTGMVTGVSAGSAIITYTVTNICGSAFVTLQIFVLPIGSFRIINLYAGTAGVYGNSGDGGSALAAKIGYPKDVAVDAVGNVYIADGEWPVIRKVTTSGIISTYAGNAAYGFYGDGGPATAAAFNGIQGVGTDGLGNIYVADGSNNRIRKINTSGIVTTCVGTGAYGYTGDGGAATAAKINSAGGICGDASGNLYIADAGNNAIRKVNTSGIISTIAGTGVSGYTGDGGPATAAKLQSPQKIAIDAAGNLYISLYNNVIRKINTSGTISTIAGTGVSGYTGDGGPATLAKITPSLGVAVDAAGNVYLSDYTYNVVRMINSSGVISTIAGTGISGYSGDGGPAVFAKMNTAMGLAVNAGGEIFIADGVNRIVRVLGAVPGSDNDAPVIVNGLSQSVTMCQSSAAVSLDTMLMVNDTDIAQTLTWSVTTAPAHGTLSGFPVSAATSPTTVTPSGLNYTPTAGYNGPDIFVVAVADGIATTTTTINVTITPAADAGTLSSSTTVCAAATNTLTSSVSGGTWTSANTAVATIGSSTGVVYGVTSGTATISYTVATACGTALQTMVLSVNSLPALTLAHGASVNVCPGESLLLSTDSLGVFDSSATTMATSFLNSPEASGTTSVCDCPPGYVVVGYSGQTGAWLDKFSLLCRQFSDGVLTGTTVATALNGTSTATPSGPYVFGGSTVMVGVQMHVSAPYFSSLGFLAGIQGYGQSASYVHSTGVNTVSPTTLTTMIGYYANAPLGTLYVPDGSVVTGMNSYNNFYSTGIALRYKPISSFYTTGASWSSSNTGVAAVSGIGVVTGVSVGTAIITYRATNSCGVTDSLIYVTVSIDADAGSIDGDSTVNVGDSTMLSSTVTGGVWSVSNTNASISSTGYLAGLSVGTVIVSYSVTGSCGTGVATYVVSVLSGISPITGSAVVCQGSSASLTNATSGGTWSSDNSSIATVGTATGLVTGVSEGTTTISYVVGTGSVTMIVSVLPLPVITGASSVCSGGSDALSASLSGGMWSSSNASVATVGSSGVVAGVSSGTASITYTLPTGCRAKIDITVNAIPGTISGSLAIFEGSAATLSSATSGGIWSSSNSAVASVGATSGVVTAVAVGTTTISYTLTTGCFRTVVVTVSSLVGCEITGTLSVCSGGVSTLSSGVSGGTWSSSNTSVATVAGSGAVTGVGAGTATITYSGSGICGVGYTTAVFTVYPLPAAITGTASVCAGSTTSLSTSPSGGTWSSSSASVATVDGSGIVSALTSGTASITYSLPTGCAAKRDVTINALPGSIGGALSVCAGTATSLSSSPSGGNWSSSNTFTATVGSASGVVTGGSSGTSRITYTLGTGCFTTEIVTVNIAPAAIAGSLSLCVGSTSSLSSATTGGTWSTDDAGIATVDEATGVMTGVGAGSTIITYSNGTCAVTATVSVGSGVTAITGSASLCVGQGTTLSNATTGGAWASGATAVATVSTSGVVTGISAGTVNITYTVSAGCFAVKNVTVNATLSAISGSLTVCPGATTSLSHTSTGGTWSSVNTTKATITAGTGVASGISAGTTTISYVLPSGCYTTAILTVNSNPSAISGTTTLCEGNTTTLSSSPGGGTWSSSSAAVATVGTSGIVTGTGAGTSIISYTLSSGCGVARDVTVTGLPTAISGSLSACIGATTTLTSSPSGGVWSSSTTAKATVNASTGVVTGVSAGTSRITYTVSGGCYVYDIVTVSATPGSISGILSLCNGSTTTLSSATWSGTWSSSAAGVATVATASITQGLVIATGVGTAIISYSIGTCAATTVVTVSAGISAITGTASVCVGTGTTLSNATSGGTWSSSATAVATVNSSGLVTGVAAGTATITYRIGTTCFATTVVTVSAAPSAITGTLSVCPGATTALGHATSGGAWSSSITAKATIDISTGIATGVASGTTKITYAVGGCFTTSTLVINAAPASIGGTATLCSGSSTSLSCSPGGGTWSSADGAVATIGATGIVSGVSAGTATISYTNGSGCASSIVVTVTAGPSAIAGTLTACIGGSTTLTSGPAGGTWTSWPTSKATVNSSTGVVTGVSAGTARITYTVSAGCYISDVVTVSAAPGALSGLSSLCSGGALTLSSATWSGAWSSSDGAVASAATLSITQGLITGLSAGTTTISYTVGSCSATKVVTVNASGGAIAGDAVVCVGQTNATLTSGLSGGTWSSSASGTANVNATTGLITGVAVGTATLTYTASPGCFITAVATVNAAVNAIAGASSVILGNTVNLTNATPGGTWTSGNTYKATIDAGTGVLTGVAAGTTMITYLVTTGCYTTRPQTVTYSRPDAPVTGATAGLFSVFPNPSSGSLTVQASVAGVFTLHTIDGKQVAQYQIKDAPTSIKLPNDLAAGVYMCRFNGADGSTEMVRLVLQK